MSKVSTRVAHLAGTLGRVRQLAAVQADKIKAKAEAAGFPALYLAAAYTEQAFGLAVRAAQWTRGSEPPTVADFVNCFADLFECRNRARELLESPDNGKVLEHWPAAPGTVYCWKADNSALAVAYAFARMIESEIFCNCPVSYGVLSTPCDTPAFTQWRDEAIAGMAEKSLPPVSDWPRWMIHRDTEALLCKLAAEYGQAVKNAQGRTPAPPTAGARDMVFISYSHKDNKFLDELLTHLKPFIREEHISSWSDKQIKPGAKWFDDIKLALASTKVAVLLVTKDFLASEFIREHELEPLLKAARQGEVGIHWIPVRACAYKETPLKDYQALISPDKPLAEMKAERDGAWVKICEAIKAAL